MQDNYSKAPIAGRQQHIQQTSPEIAQRLAAQQTTQQHLVDQSRAVPAEGRDEVELHLDERPAPDQRRRRRRQPDPAQEDEGTSSAPESEGATHIDLTA
jgi:hypothetical protein